MRIKEENVYYQIVSVCDQDAERSAVKWGNILVKKESTLYL